ncbi:IS607 family element RNA-guided endonuclease TnpB [Crossiella cryophila]|uniref:IS607 family element RNA-guided endonuclease TnpB n=1 Tax=Crossiella cryophila TaxID=43355 RepID=UPI001FE46F42|nr:IS607 family element RNA-guided endonuclease TnpB [Crossiella cryophila]
MDNWRASRSGVRRGPRMRFPRFKGRRACLSCRFTTGTFGLAKHDRRHVRLPRIGLVRTHESTRKLARHVERGTARIRSATISHRAGRWFVSFSVEIIRAARTPARPDAVIGVDLGLSHLAVLSTGQVIPNPRHLELAQRTLRRLQRQAARRQGPDRGTQRSPSARWRRTQDKVSRLHTSITNARGDGLNKLTSKLATTFGTIVLEDLNVAGMLRNRRLARHIAGAGWGELRRQLQYKVLCHGSRLLLADRWYPSSKTCSDCGVAKAKLRLSERTFTCDSCGMRRDRDLNAARNLAMLCPPTVGGRHETSPRETHVRPTSGGQRVLPREDPYRSVRANTATAR